MGVVRFLLFNYPDTLPELPFTFRPGMTIRDLAEECAQVSGVTAPASEMLNTGAMVDGKYVSTDYKFDGSEGAVDFMNQIGDG